MNKSIIETIEFALAYIESGLTRKLTILDIAKAVHMSKYHTHRLLSRAVGQPIMSYIQARRLSASIELLLESQYNIIDISRYFAFEHEQSYIRAFKKLYHVTPAQFRKAPLDLSLTEKNDLSHLKALHDGLIFTPRVVYKPTFHIVGPRYKIVQEDNLQNFTANLVANQFMNKDKHSIHHKIHDHVYIGFTRYESWEEESYSYYFPSVQVSSFDNLPPGMETNVIPGGKYAVFTYVGSFHPRHLTILHLEQISDYIMKYVQLHKPNFYQSQPFHFEYIDESLATEHYCEVDIYFPIQTITIE